MANNLDRLPKHLWTVFLSALVAAIVSTGSSYFLMVEQANKNFEIWTQQEERKQQTANVIRQRQIVREIRVIHTELLAADTKFYFAAEIESLRAALSKAANNAPNFQKGSFDNILRSVAGRLGVNGPESHFSSTATEYNTLLSEFEGLLVEVDFYFSDNVVAMARDYLVSIKQETGRLPDRVKFWLETIEQITGAASRDALEVQGVSEKIWQNMIAEQNRQKFNVALYNNLYQAMRNEVTPYK